MQMKKLVNGILRKSLKLDDIKEKLSKSELEELMLSLAAVKAELQKGCHKPECMGLNKGGQWSIHKNDDKTVTSSKTITDKYYAGLKQDKHKSGKKKLQIRLKMAAANLATSKFKYRSQPAHLQSNVEHMNGIKQQITRDTEAHADLKSQLKNHIKNKPMKKSNYDGYTEADNIKRKKNNIETGDTGKIKVLPRTKKYSKTGADKLSRDVKDLKRKSKKSPVKIFTPEEIAEINNKNKIKKN
jgi:hypothetical protein